MLGGGVRRKVHPGGRSSINKCITRAVLANGVNFNVTGVPGVRWEMWHSSRPQVSMIIQTIWVYWALGIKHQLPKDHTSGKNLGPSPRSSSLRWGEHDINYTGLKGTWSSTMNHINVCLCKYFLLIYIFGGTLKAFLLINQMPNPIDYIDQAQNRISTCNIQYAGFSFPELSNSPHC